MANSTSIPNAGSLNLSNKNPRVTPLAGGLPTAGIQGSITVGSTTTVVPFNGVLGLPGQVGTVKLQGLIRPSSAILSATGQPGTNSGSLLPATGTLTLSPATGAIAQTNVLVPNAGNLTLAVGGPFQPPTASLTLAGRQAALSLGIVRPNTAALTLAGLAAIAVAGGGSRTLTPTTGAAFFGEALEVPTTIGTLVMAGAAPSLLINAIRPTVPGSLIFTEISGTILGIIIAPDSASLVFTSGSGNVSRSLIPATGSLGLSGQFATVGGVIQIVPSTGTIQIASGLPSLNISGNVVLRPLIGALAFSGIAPVRDRGIVSLTGSLILTEGLSSVPPAGLIPASNTLTLAGLPVGLFFQTFRIPGTASLVVLGRPPAVGGLPPRGGIAFRVPPPRRSRVFVVPQREEALT